MSHFAVNWLAVITATIASFGFGAGWYTLLSKQWLAAIGRTPKQGDYTPFIWSAVVLFVMAYFIALLTPALTGSVNVGNGLLVGAHMWVGFILTAMVLNHRYEGAPWSLTAINGGYLLTVLLIDGLVIGLFG
jgi:hypothetical protein